MFIFAHVIELLHRSHVVFLVFLLNCFGKQKRSILTIHSPKINVNRFFTVYWNSVNIFLKILNWYFD